MPRVANQAAACHGDLKCPFRFPLSNSHQHMWNIHGVRDSGTQVANQTVSQVASETPLTGPLYVTSVHWVPEVEHRNHGSTVPFENNVFEGSSTAGIHDLPTGRFYCQEYDCGRGFSSNEHLDSHLKFFHPKKVGNALSSGGTKADVNEKARTNQRGSKRCRRVLERYPRGGRNISGSHHCVPFPNFNPQLPQLWGTCDAGKS